MGNQEEAEKISSAEIQANVSFQIQSAEAVGKIPTINLSEMKSKKGVCDYEENEIWPVQVVGC